MCTTCVSTASQAASWGPPALAAGAAAVLTGVRTRFPARRRTRATTADASATVDVAPGPDGSHPTA